LKKNIIITTPIKLIAAFDITFISTAEEAFPGDIPFLLNANIRKGVPPEFIGVIILKKFFKAVNFNAVHNPILSPVPQTKLFKDNASIPSVAAHSTVRTMRKEKFNPDRTSNVSSVVVKTNTRPTEIILTTKKIIIFFKFTNNFILPP